MSVLKIQDNLYEGFLDDNHEYYDYGTATFDGKNPIDEATTGTSYYDDFLAPAGLSYVRKEKNLDGKIVMMTPNEYYKECANRIFNTSVSRLKIERGVYDKNIIEHLLNVLTVYKRKLCLPMINYADKGQEGLHRMYTIGELLGWDYKVPVLIVDWYDTERAEIEERRKQQAKIDRKVETAIQGALYYKYSDISDLEDQLAWELEKQFQYADDVTLPQEVILTPHSNTYVLTFLQHEYTINKDDINFKTVDIEDELSIDELELDDADDFLNTYLAEELNNKIQTMHNEILAHFYG